MMKLLFFSYMLKSLFDSQTIFLQNNSKLTPKDFKIDNEEHSQLLIAILVFLHPKNRYHRQHNENMLT